LFYAYQKPTYERQTIVLGTYTHRATYDCIAELKPNIIYNKTTLRQGEGTLYTAITTRINVTFTYTFTSNPNPESANIIMENIVVEIESPGKWVKTLRESEIREIMSLEGSVNFTLRIDCAAIRQLIDKIDKEVGTYTSSYNVYVTPTIRINAIVAERTVNETYTPELTIAFKTGTEKGNYISINGLNQTRNRSITETKEIAHPEVEAQRNASYLATATTAIGLAASAITYIRESSKLKPKKEGDEKVRRVAEEYKDIIAEAEKAPPETQTTIEVKSLEDLTKIAEILAKPIIKTAEPEEQTFYIIDGNIKYQYTAKAKP
ncbi:MAG: DUF5305 family protein, partial [Candidatus Bathyarchaeia archaeon]